MAQKKEPVRRKILAAGGDLRQVTAAELLAAQAEVQLVGFDRLGVLPDGVQAIGNAGGLPAHSADVLLLPVTPVCETVPAPCGAEELPLPVLLRAVKRGGLVLCGRLNEAVRERFAEADCRAEDYTARESFAVRNAVPTAEAAIAVIVRELPVTVSGLSCLILGAGRISQALQPRLRALGADVCVAARRCSDLARSGGSEGKPAPAFSVRFSPECSSR